MEISVHPFSEGFLSFICDVYEQNMEALHGGVIPEHEWRKYFVGEAADPSEVNYVVAVNQKPAAWIKLNGLDGDGIYISMLVVDDLYKHQGIGSYAIQFAEAFAQNNGKAAVRIKTTKDNIAAVKCYLKQGYRIIREINYTVGDDVARDGYEFIKSI